MATTINVVIELACSMMDNGQLQAVVCRKRRSLREVVAWLGSEANGPKQVAFAESLISFISGNLTDEQMRDAMDAATAGGK